MQAAESQGASWPGAVAVSGGADSMALLLLLSEWARKNRRPPPVVLTVDHGLRPGSARDAARVTARAEGWGLEAHVLSWAGRKPQANIESAARAARYRLMGSWCRAAGLKCLYLAHTMDDQAETFLLRLARGSGVDGLAAMTEVSPFPSPGCEGLRVARPLLGIPRPRLRAFLETRAETWLEDPMNSDPRFARVRLRAAWSTLEGLGLSATRVAGAARHLARARAALVHDADALLARASIARGGCVLADADQLAAAPEEIGLRALAGLLTQVSGRTYKPRFERLERLFAAICGGGLGAGRTLHGCCIKPVAKRDAVFGEHTLRIKREAGRSREVRREEDAS